ncbi:hypothetical protein [Dactylosporangium salmoneum]|uniref:hypothetical protein n=1 Tax=Dactylosporangium salmoneum TaxID=53361 RepID=UPI0031D164F8
MAGSITTNSSPPSRAARSPSRTWARSRSATTRSSSSPAAWPSSSWDRLEAVEVQDEYRRDVPGAKDAAGVLVQQVAVAQPGQRVVQGLLAQAGPGGGQLAQVVVVGPGQQPGHHRHHQLQPGRDADQVGGHLAAHQLRRLPVQQEVGGAGHRADQQRAGELVAVRGHDDRDDEQRPEHQVGGAGRAEDHADDRQGVHGHQDGAQPQVARLGHAAERHHGEPVDEPLGPRRGQAQGGRHAGDGRQHGDGRDDPQHRAGAADDAGPLQAAAHAHERLVDGHITHSAASPPT